jgi:hypothetical protein
MLGALIGQIYPDHLWTAQCKPAILNSQEARILMQEAREPRRSSIATHGTSSLPHTTVVRRHRDLLE